MADRKVDPFENYSDTPSEYTELADDNYGPASLDTLKDISGRVRADDEKRAKFARERDAKYFASMKRRWEIEDEILRNLPAAKLFVVVKWREIQDLYDRFVEEMAARQRGG